MNFIYAENKKCSCGNNAKFELSDETGALYMCTECMRSVAAGFFGLTNLANAVAGNESKKKPGNLHEDLGEISFEHNREQIIVDPFVCKNYTPTLYFRNTKKYVPFDWDNLINIAINLGAAKK